jgi:hypothetical protein
VISSTTRARHYQPNGTGLAIFGCLQDLTQFSKLQSFVRNHNQNDLPNEQWKTPTQPGAPIPAAHPRSARVNTPRETAHPETAREADTAQTGKTRTDPGTKAKRPLDFSGITRLPTPLFPQS